MYAHPITLIGTGTECPSAPHTRKPGGLLPYIELIHISVVFGVHLIIERGQSVMVLYVS
jgi:hypothetical protein